MNRMRQPARRNSTILLIEDDPARLIALAMILRSSGYNVLEAGDQSEATDTCMTHPGAIQLLLTEFELDGDRGPQIAERLLGLSPEMQVLLLFHSPPSKLLDGIALSCGYTILPEPCDPVVLADTIRHVLDSLESRPQPVKRFRAKRATRSRFSKGRGGAVAGATGS